MTADTYHRQVTVLLNLMPVEVDEGIADLIVALRAAGFRTVSSCQDMGETVPAVPQGRAIVAFDGRAQAVEFHRLAGGQLVEVEPEDRAAAQEKGDLPDDPAYDVSLSTVAVLFPTAAIEATVGKVERLAPKSAEGLGD